MTDTVEAPPNSRFIDMGGGTTAELMSNQVQFFYDPTTQAARAIFNGMPYLNIANTYHALNASPDILHVDFTDKLAKCYAAGLGVPITDPNTGADLTKISVYGVMILLKVAYDVEVNLREANRLAAIAEAAAAAAKAAAKVAADDVLALAAQSAASPSPNGVKASFTIDPAYLRVTFTDTSVTPADLTITQWHWYFGDTYGSSTEQHPSHVYAEPGLYTVILVVSDSDGSLTKCSEQITVTV
jgi:PKD repeat protein